MGDDRTRVWAPRRQIRQGWLPTVGLAFAIASCYGTLALVAILATFGIAIRINNLLWGAVITMAAAISWLALARNARRHGRIAPVLLSFLGLCAIAWAMMLRYLLGLEVAGFGALLGGILWDRQYCSCPCSDKQSDR